MKQFIFIFCRRLMIFIFLCSLQTMMACGSGGDSLTDDDPGSGGGGNGGSETGSISVPEGYNMSVELNGTTYYEESSIISFFYILENGEPEEEYGSEDMGFYFGTETVFVTDDLTIRVSATVSSYYPLTTQTPFELYANEVDYPIGSIYVNGVPCDIEHIIIDFERIDTGTDHSYLKAVVLLEPEGGDGEEIIYRMNTYLGFMDMDSSGE